MKMKTIDFIEKVLQQIKPLNIKSQEMHDFINSLKKEEYALIRTVAIIGRSGWEKKYNDTTEYSSFIEESQAHGEHVNDEILDKKFLTEKGKREEVKVIYNQELRISSKFNGEYNYNSLSNNINLTSQIEKGLSLLKSI